MPEGDFSDKLEELFEGLASFLHRFLRTVRVFVRHPWRASRILADPRDGRYLAPFTFMVAAYGALVVTVAAVRDLTLMDVREGELIRGVADTVVGRIMEQEYSPMKMLLLALPVVLVLLAAAYACRRLAGVGAAPAVALIAYSAGYAWAVAAAALFFVVLLVLALVSFPRAEPVIDVVGPLGLLALGWALLVPLAAYVWNTARAAAGSAGGWSRAAKVAVVLALTAGAHAVDATIILHGAAAGPGEAPALDVHVRYLSVGGDSLPWGDPRYDDFAPVGADAELVSAAPGPRQRNRPVEALVALRNRSSRTLYLFRDPPRRLSDGFWLHLARTPAPPGDLEDTARVVMVRRGAAFMSIREWADGASPVMVLRPNDVKWVRLRGETDAMRTPLDVTGLAFRIGLRTADGTAIRSGWQWVSPGMRFDAPPAGSPAQSTARRSQ